jgi:hypothetical protein
MASEALDGESLLSTPLQAIAVGNFRARSSSASHPLCRAPKRTFFLNLLGWRRKRVMMLGDLNKGACRA